MWKKLLLPAAVLALTAPAVPATARPPLPDTTDGGFLKEAVAAANRHRAQHGVPPLALDPALTAYARKRAREISRGAPGQLSTEGADPRLGEDLFWSSAGTERAPAAGAAQAVETWYAEARSYDWRKPGFSAATGDFTQLVWKASDRLGAARVSGRAGGRTESYVVFAFAPPGNVDGAFRENVLPRK
ncbi:CAP family protein [Streptomyces sp. NPDC002536]